MIILSLDTSCKTAMVSAAEDDTILASVTVQDHKTHSVKMLPAVEYVLSAAGKLPGDVSLVAVTNGPGSYTGLRIGVTTAKTFAYSLNIPVVGINTLEMLAASLCGAQDFLICPMIDARNTRVYAALYRGGQVLRDAYAVSCEELFAMIEETYPGEKVYFTGDGALANRALIEKSMGGLYGRVPPELSLGSPAAISMLARMKYRTGIPKAFTAEKLKVNYYKNYTDTI